MNNLSEIEKSLSSLSSKLSKSDTLVIILAAGHGKRIKSSTSKMLHKIWGIPSVERVRVAFNSGIPKVNTSIVVGIKALEVASTIGNQKNTAFVYQEKQLGTGHAVLVALDNIDFSSIKYCYVIYADMGLMNESTIKEFHSTFIKSKKDMIVMTANYSGAIGDNHYGRILRVRALTSSGVRSKYKLDKKTDVIGVMEYKDILAMDDNSKIYLNYKDEKFSFEKDDLLDSIKEYNAGVYGFKIEYLKKFIKEIKSNNSQGEFYLTDIVDLFVKSGLSIATYTPKDERVVLGFNDKTVLKEMETIARKNVYEKLKNIITILDSEDFFIDDSIVSDIVKMESDNKPLDIFIGKGGMIEKGVSINYGITIESGAKLSGNIHLGENARIGENVLISCLEKQKLTIEDSVYIHNDNQIKGNVFIGENTILERGVNITGSDENPTTIGKNVLIKGVSYLYGTIVDDNASIEHCIFYYSHINTKYDSDGNVIKCRFIRPNAEGVECVSVIKQKNSKTKIFNK